MAFGDDHTVWLEVMKHLKSNLDLYMVSQCNKKLNGIGWFSNSESVTLWFISSGPYVLIHKFWFISMDHKS